MLRLGRLDDAEDPGALPARAHGRRSRMPAYIAAAFLLLLASDLLIHRLA